VTGRDARPRACWSETPFWRRARSSAALSNAHLRYWRALSRMGATANRLARPSSRENSSNVRVPCSQARSSPALRNSIWSIWSHVMSSPSPTCEPPLSRTTIEILVNPPEVSRTSGRSSQRSTTSGSPATCA